MLKAGVPASKLLLGIPAYAREMNHPQEVKTYEEIYRLGAQAPQFTGYARPDCGNRYERS